MSKCIIIAAMELTETAAEYIKNLNEDSYIICADAGYEHALVNGIQPDMVLGDFDSLTSDISRYAGELKRFSIEKDDTDTMLAVKEGLALGYTEFLLFGVLGGRLDHTFANISTLSYLCNKGARGWLISEENCVTMIKDDIICLKRCKKLPNLSIFAYNDVVENVNISGCKYNLSNRLLTSSFPLGVSNEIILGEAAISVGNGQLLVIISK